MLFCQTMSDTEMRSPMGHRASLSDRDQSPAKSAPQPGAGDGAAAPSARGATLTRLQRGRWVAPRLVGGRRTGGLWAG